MKQSVGLQSILKKDVNIIPPFYITVRAQQQNLQQLRKQAIFAKSGSLCTQHTLHDSSCQMKAFLTKGNKLITWDKFALNVGKKIILLQHYRVIHIWNVQVAKNANTLNNKFLIAVVLYYVCQIWYVILKKRHTFNNKKLWEIKLIKLRSFKYKCEKSYKQQKSRIMKISLANIIFQTSSRGRSLVFPNQRGSGIKCLYSVQTSEGFR